jgi:outer membrane immunogenic protein
MIRAMALGLLAATAVSSAMAADLIVDEPTADVAASSYDWNGAYIGAFAGYGAGTTTFDFLYYPSSVDIDTSGWLVGGTVGANFQNGNFVLGVEGDVAWSDIGNTEFCPNPSYDCSSSIDWLATLRGRAGFAADAVLLYATAGLAVGGVTSDTTYNGEFSSTHFGWAAGFGAEVGVTEDVSIKAEYLYVDLGTQTDDDYILDPNPPVDVSPVAHTAKVGVNFHF